MQKCTQACLEGSKAITAPLPSLMDGMRVILCLIYGDSPADLQTWEMSKFVVAILPTKIRLVLDMRLVSEIGGYVKLSNASVTAGANCALHDVD